ncbi:MAG: ABC transporter substrate-binding protein [Hyphomicrobiaceae bacterium]|nr:ABC transporter substrate-binding protein [Hyphomicrobiaceae bacterium]
MPSDTAPPRVVSLIASATEMVWAMGRGEVQVGRSHECDFPAEVARLPALTAPKFKVEGSSGEINGRVSRIVRDGLSVCRVDAEALRALDPSVILTQDHCEVCAVSLADVAAAVCAWAGRPVRVVSLKPDSLATACADMHKVADALSVPEAGEALVWQMRQRIASVTARVAGRPRPRVAFIEWVDPLMAGGNWIPELITAAGGANLFGEAGRRSDWIEWQDLAAADPDAIVVAPCGYGLARCLQELPLLEARPGWAGLAAARSGRVYFADGNAYCNRPGPRLADTTEILAEMLHPAAAGRSHEGTAWVAKPR